MAIFEWVLGVWIVATTVWMALAVHCHLRWLWLRRIATFGLLTIIGGSVWFVGLIPWGVVIWAGCFLAILAWWLTLRPRLDRDWALEMSVLPHVEVVGDKVRIRNFRNFEYASPGRSTPRYEDRTFDLTQLASLDYFLSHWSGPFLAHTLVSFGFRDGQYLTVSVEARRQRWQSYSPLWGLFRAYELMFVLGDERDILQLRTNVRRERVYIYRLRLSPESIRRLLLDYLNKAESLTTNPEWYHSITSNCTTNLFFTGHRRVPWWIRLGILINGLSARSMYRVGVLADDTSFSELQARSDISDLAIDAEHNGDYSHRIRAQLVLPRS